MANPDILDYPNAVHDFMQASVPLDESGRARLHELATHAFGGAANTASADFCLNSAVTYAQADKLPILVDQYGADIQQYPRLSSDRHPGQPYVSNLLEDAVQAYRIRPDTDHSPEGKARLLATVEFLLKRGLSATPNADPIDGALNDAYILSHPEEAMDENSVLESGWLMALRDPDAELEEPFPEPYELIRKYQPDAVTAFETALAAARAIAPKFF